MHGCGESTAISDNVVLRISSMSMIQTYEGGMCLFYCLLSLDITKLQKDFQQNCELLSTFSLPLLDETLR